MQFYSPMSSICTRNSKLHIYILIIICVPPIILGQVLRSFPRVTAIHVNSFITSRSACMNAVPNQFPAPKKKKKKKSIVKGRK